ncbi:PQQ-dependent sugar dehydrogenase [Parapedobacter lycopersici]|uniref:PQQ-dependent sugar dehydrogenase n=1 Tax=Parapedobacter lycopersici TaxID=1864939 RepID=UPI00214D19A2|nr:PQQ-dependent sugar dehydrogenase [Parapedobacter lycopersici]
MRTLPFFLILVFFCCVGCTRMADTLPPGDADNGGLILPGGFEAVTVVDSLGKARHLAVTANGDMYVKLRDAQPNAGNVALRDTDGDGKADSIVFFGDYEVTPGYGPTGMRIYNDYLYFSSAGAVYRTKLTPGQLVPEGETETILVDDYKNDVHGYEHMAKPLAFDNEGHLYVSFGAPSDICQLGGRVPGAPGQFPCPELEDHGGIWQFDANKTNQTQRDGKRYVTGLRSVVGMSWNSESNALYALQHGRDYLNTSWPEYYNAWDSGMLPSEEFFRLEEGDNAGWPYYYYDQLQGKKLLNPEYGGDGKKTGGADSIAQPLIGFPGHWAPNDLLFYTGDQFPARYKNGAFIAFHGSTIRTPYPQSGYFVCFVPFRDGKPSGPWEVFADGFAQQDTIVNTSDAAHRPVGLAMGPDGSLYISDSVKGTIWRVMFKGDKNAFGATELQAMEERKMRSNIKDPDPVADHLDRGQANVGATLYNSYCASCHQRNGQGDSNRFPPLNGSEWVNGDKRKLIELTLQGLEGPITVKGQSFNGVMPPHGFLADDELAKILTYIRLNFDNNSSAISAADVARSRKAIADRTE